jgi:hypothetical protein
MQKKMCQGSTIESRLEVSGEYQIARHALHFLLHTACAIYIRNKFPHCPRFLCSISSLHQADKSQAGVKNQIPIIRQQLHPLISAVITPKSFICSSLVAN